MKKEVLNRANELNKRIEALENFIHTFSQTWKHGILKSRAELTIGHTSFGAYKYSEIQADEVLSEKIYNALLEYQIEIQKEFNELK